MARSTQAVISPEGALQGVITALSCTPCKNKDCERAPIQTKGWPIREERQGSYCEA
uniref:Uncharacterized protein n=1 Tax=Anguilla anguilla TaxID=7936 RepID=A0A0E9T0E7_ANGAN